MRTSAAWRHSPRPACSMTRPGCPVGPARPAVGGRKTARCRPASLPVQRVERRPPAQSCPLTGQYRKCGVRGAPSVTSTQQAAHHHWYPAGNTPLLVPSRQCANTGTQQATHRYWYPAGSVPKLVPSRQCANTGTQQAVCHHWYPAGNTPSLVASRQYAITGTQ